MTRFYVDWHNTVNSLTNSSLEQIKSGAIPAANMVIKWAIEKFDLKNVYHGQTQTPSAQQNTGPDFKPFVIPKK